MPVRAGEIGGGEVAPQPAKIEAAKKQYIQQ
jgi:hypothetical protein